LSADENRKYGLCASLGLPWVILPSVLVQLPDRIAGKLQVGQGPAGVAA
jgi:hypothetical protein